MDRNVHFLNTIYQDANDSSRSLDALLPRTRDTLIAGEMQRQLSEYRAISRQAERLIESYNADPQEKHPAAEAASRAGKQLSVALDDSHARIAELLIKEGTQGVSNLTRTIKEFALCDKPVADLGQKMLEARQQHIEQLKRYL